MQHSVTTTRNEETGPNATTFKFEIKASPDWLYDAMWEIKKKKKTQPYVILTDIFWYHVLTGLFLFYVTAHLSWLYCTT